MADIQRICLSNMSHSIKTPLNAILGFSENLMSDMSLNSPEREMLSAIHNSGKIMLGMLNDAFDIELIQTNRLILDKIPIDLQLFLKNLENKLRPKIGIPFLTININVMEGFPRYIVMDENALTQIFLNFSTEITQLNKQGELCINIRREEKSKFICMISNGPTTEWFFNSSPGSSENILDMSQRNLKPPLVLATLLVQYMGGRAFFHRISKDTGGFFFEINLEKDALFGENIKYNPDMQKELHDVASQNVLDNIPKSLLLEMGDALKRTRFDILLKLIKKIKKYDATLAHHLQISAKNYDYETIQGLLGLKNAT